MAEAFWVVGENRGEIREQALGVLAPGMVRVRATASAISRGTESLVFQGRVPLSQAEIMRCPHQEGSFPFPVKYGYCSVGRVIESQAAAVAVGTRVFCLYPHQTEYDVAASAVVAIPDTVSDRRATLAANLETAINALWDAPPLIGDRIVVIGGGLVGLMIATLASLVPGTQVQVIEPSVARAETASDLGLAVATPDRALYDADLVVHASGNPQGLALGLELAGFEATVLEVSWYGDKSVPLPLGEAFHSRRLRLISSQVGAVSDRRRARRGHRDRLATALDLLADPLWDVLLADPIAFRDLPQAMARLAAAPLGRPAVTVAYD